MNIPITSITLCIDKHEETIVFKTELPASLIVLNNYDHGKQNIEFRCRRGHGEKYLRENFPDYTYKITDRTKWPEWPPLPE